MYETIILITSALRFTLLHMTSSDVIPLLQNLSVFIAMNPYIG